MWFDVPVGLSNPGAPRLALSRSSAMAWCLAILLLLALLAPGALQEAAWRPLTALLPQLATFALPFMATSLVSLLDTLSHSLSSPSPSSSSSVAALLLRMLHVVKNVLHPFCFAFLMKKKRYYHASKFSSSQDAYTTLAKNGSRSIACMFFFLISILMSCLAADLAVGWATFFENGPRNSIVDETRVADVDKERMRFGGEEGAGREGPRMQRTNFRPRSDEVKQYRTWVTQKGVGAFVHSPREGRGAHFFFFKIQNKIEDRRLAL